MDNTKPLVIAFAYHDGPTEGIVCGLAGHERPHYFKVVAWDEDQDDRLYLLWQVDEGGYLQLLNLLQGMGARPAEKVWVPIWHFHDVASQDAADGLVDSLKRSYAPPYLLLYGRDVLESAHQLAPPETAVAAAVDLLGQNAIVDVHDWLLSNGLEPPSR